MCVKCVCWSKFDYQLCAGVPRLSHSIQLEWNRRVPEQWGGGGVPGPAAGRATSPELSWLNVRLVKAGGGQIRELQGYLAHTKTPTPPGLP